MFPLYSRQTDLQKASRIVESKQLADIFDSSSDVTQTLSLSLSRARACTSLSLSLSGARLLSLPGKIKLRTKKRYQSGTLVSYLWWILSIFFSFICEPLLTFLLDSGNLRPQCCVALPSTSLHR